MLNTFLQDVRYAIRLFLAKPGFTIVVVMTLALGIGLNSAIFSVVNAILLRPLPYSNPDRLVMVWSNNLQQNRPQMNVSYPDFTDLKQHNQAMEDLAAYIFNLFNVTGGAESEQVRGTVATGNLFQVLGASAAIGRVFTPEEEGERLVVLSHGFWERRYGGNARVLGQSVILNDEPHTIIGVMPRDFQFPPLIDRAGGAVELWTNLAPVSGARSSPLASRGFRGLRVVGRLKPGVTLGQAQIDMTNAAQIIEQENRNSNAGMGASVVSLNEQVVKGVRPALLVLLGAVGFVLLIACGNVASLLLARITAREKEFAVRTALGASRGRIIRMLLTESMLLSFVGGVLGAILAFWALRLLLGFNSVDIPRIETVSVDYRFVLFGVAIMLLVGLISGLAPILTVFKVNLNESLKEGGRSSSRGLPGIRLQKALIVSEFVLALVLLIGAGLMIRSFERLMDSNHGFNPENVVTMRVNLSVNKYAQPAQQANFYQQVIENIKGLPGVESVGASISLPPSISQRRGPFSIEGQQVSEGQLPTAQFIPVSADYFKTLRIPLIQGRFFTDADAQDAPLVAVVSESLVRRYFGGEDLVGKRIKQGSPNSRSPWATVVGVVGDVKYSGLEAEADPELYVSYLQNPFGGMYLVARTSSDQLQRMLALRDAVYSVDRDQPVAELKTLEDVVYDAVAQRRFNTLLLVIFAGTALTLAVIGIYGVMSYSVSQRTREIGIRMAIGAQHADVLKMVVGQGMKLAVIGVIIGLVGAFAVTRIMSSLLYGISALDVVTFVAAAGVLTAIAALACFVPARRATKIDPLHALRYE